MKNLGLTVKALSEACTELIKQGMGDKHILISDDDEGNGYHTLFYLFTTSNCDDYNALLELEHDGTHTPENSVILG